LATFNGTTLGNNIRFFRKKRGLTQAALAETIGVSDSFIGQLENARAAPSLEAFTAIANSLGIGADRLLHENLQHREDSFTEQILEHTKNRPHEQKNFAMDLINAILGVLFIHQNLWNGEKKGNDGGVY